MRNLNRWICFVSLFVVSCNAYNDIKHQERINTLELFVGELIDDNLAARKRLYDKFKAEGLIE